MGRARPWPLVAALSSALALAGAASAQETPADRLAAALAEHREAGLELDLALARLGPLEGPALDALVDALRRDDELRPALLEVAVPALGPAAEGLLLRLWEGATVELRRDLLEPLAAAGGEPAVGPLVAALGDPALGDAAARSLVTLLHRAPAEGVAARLREVVGAGGPGAGPALGALAEVDGARALPELAAALGPDGPPDVRRAALGALARADRSRPGWQLEGEEALAGLRERLGAALDDAGAATADQLLTLQALRVWGDLSHVEALLQRAEREPALTAVAQQALAEISGVRAATLAERRAWWDAIAPAWRRFDALRVAVRTGGAEALAALPLLATVPDPRAVEAIDDLVQQLSEGWDPPAPELAEACCAALARLGLTAGATPLLRLLDDRGASFAVKRRAAWALGVLAGAEGSTDPAAWRRVFPDALPPAAPASEAEPPVAATEPAPRRPAQVGARRRGGARVERAGLEPLPPGRVPTGIAAAPAGGPAAPAAGSADPAGRRAAASAPGSPPPEVAAAAPPAPGAGREKVLALGAVAALAVVALALAFAPAGAGRRLQVPVGAGVGTGSVARLPRGGAAVVDEPDDGVVSIQLSASGRFSAITVDGVEARPPTSPAPRDPATEALDAVLASIPRLADALVSISARLASASSDRRSAGAAPDRRVLFRADGDTPLDAALAALRALGALVCDVVVGLRGSGLDLVVYEKAPVAPPAAADDGSWRRLLTLVGHGVGGFDELEVRTGSVWRSVLERDDDAPATLARLGAMDPGAVEEVRARLRGGARVTLLDRRGAPRRAAESRWAELLEGLERHGHEVELLEVAGPGGAPLRLFEAGDRARFVSAREALRSGAAGPGPFAAHLRSSGIEVPLPDDPVDRDAVLEDLGLDALASVTGPAGPAFSAEDGPRLRHALEALAFDGPARHPAVRARLRDGRLLAYDAPAAASPDAPAEPAARPRPESSLAAELPVAAPATDPLEADLERLHGDLARLGPALTGLSARLRTGPEPRTLLRPGEPRRPAFTALKALAPLLEEVTATVAGCGLELLLLRRAGAAPAPVAKDAGPDLRGLEGALAAFEVVEVRELGRLWRTIQDAGTDRVDAVQALGALSAEAVQEIRARTRSGTRATLFRRDGDGSDGSGAGWAAMLGDLHRLAPTLVGLDVALKGAPPKALFEGTDPARFAAARAALRAGPVGSARVALRGTDVVLPLAGTADEVDGALLELGLGTIQRLVVDEPDGAERAIFEAADGASFAGAIDALVRQRADVVEVRARVDGEAEPRLLYPRPLPA